LALVNKIRDEGTNRSKIMETLGVLTDEIGPRLTETGLVYLTHPLAGFYHRRDGKLGTYRVWHKQLLVRAANLVSAEFELLNRMGWVTEAEQQLPHSVLIEPLNEFTIYLPPKIVPPKFKRSC
jgi:hypothetical protein